MLLCVKKIEGKKLSDDKNKFMRKTENLTNRAFTFTPETNDGTGNIKKKKISFQSAVGPFPVVILGQNCVRLSDAALDDFFLFFQKFVLQKAV